MVQKQALVLFLSGFLLASGLWLIDELITLLRYCPGCGYKLPLLGVWDVYDAEGLAWIVIVAAFLLVLFYKKRL